MSFAKEKTPKNIEENCRNKGRDLLERRDHAYTPKPSR